MIENFGWLIEGEVAGSGGLIHHEKLGWLREKGIGAIVSLTERFAAPGKAAAAPA